MSPWVSTTANVSPYFSVRRGLVTGAVYVDRARVEHFQPADVTILGANGIGTPRLLLLSASGRHPS